MMWWKMTACVFLSALTAASGEIAPPATGAELKLAAPAPAITVEDQSGARRPLSEFRGRKVVLLIAGAVPEGLDEAAGELRRRGTVVLAAAPRSDGAEGREACLIDEGGIVRRIGPLPSSGDGVIGFVEEWEEGRTFFLNRCARCHGEDGADDSYPYIKPLAGMGRRLTRMQIRAKLHPAVAGPDYIMVRGDAFTARQFEALMTFIAGL